MLSVGDIAPQFASRSICGPFIDVEKLSAERPLALCFLNHTNTSWCREGMAAIQASWNQFDLEGVHLAAVIPSELEVARDFVPRFHILFPVVADPDREIFERYQIPSANRIERLRAMGPEQIREGMRIIRQGLGGFIDPQAIRPAEFVISEGKIAYAHYGDGVSSIPDIESLLGAVRACAA